MKHHNKKKFKNFTDGSMSGMVALICFWNFGILLICDNDDSVHMVENNDDFIYTKKF